jgi:hypothetical protein
VLEHTFTAQSNSRRALLILELVRGRRLLLPDEAEVVTEFAAVRLRETSPGVYRYDHDSGKHDDRVTAISLGAHHLLEQPAMSLAAPWVGRRESPRRLEDAEVAPSIGGRVTQIQPVGLAGAAIVNPDVGEEPRGPSFTRRV